MESGPELKKLSNIILVGMCALLTISLIFYKERVFFADAAYVLFNSINYRSFAIQFDRYGSFITQLFPYLGQKFGLPLNIIFVAYAGSFSFFYLTVTFILTRLQQYSLVIIAGLFYFLIVSSSFYWTNEIPQGAGWMFLMFGSLLHLSKRKANTWLTLILFTVLAVLTIFTHFVLLMPMAFLWLYLILDKQHWSISNQKTWLFSAILVAVVLSKFYASLGSTTDSWDALHLHNVTHVSFKDVYRSFTTPVVSMFLSRCLSNYWVAVILFLLDIIILAKQRKWLLLGLFLLGCTGYVAVMGLAYGDLGPDVFLFHIESEWMCIGILLAVPLVFHCLSALTTMQAGMLITTVLIIRVCYILAAVTTFTHRTNIQADIMSQMKKKGITKLALYRTPAIHSTYMIDWAVGYESLLRSSAQGDKPNLTYIFIDSANNQHMLDAVAVPGDLYLWDPMHAANFNRRYYTVDSVHPYTVMSYPELMK